MSSSRQSREAFYAAARKELAVLKLHPKLRRKELMPRLTFLLEGLLLLLEERDRNET